MDLSGIIGQVGGAMGGGGGGNTGMALGIGGDFIQTMSDFITPEFVAGYLREANREASNRLERGYDTAGEFLKKGYDQGKGDINTALGQTAGAYQQGYGGAERAEQPYEQIGREGAVSLGSLLRKGGFQFDPNSFDMTQDPGYQARLREGQNAIENSAAARGGLLSGATLKALNRFGQDFASNEYANAYGRAYGAAQDRYNSQVNLGQTLAGMGQNAAGRIGNYRAGLGTSLGSAYTGAGGNLANLSVGYGTGMSGLEKERATTLSDLMLNLGNINAAKAQGTGKAVSNFGERMKSWGGMSGGGAGMSGGIKPDMAAMEGGLA